MTLYDKFGWVIPVQSYLDSWEYSKSPPLRLDSIPDRKQDLPAGASNVAICYYLQGNIAEAKRFAREAVDAVLDYFFGDWRQQVPTELGTLDPAWWHANISWADFFSLGLCWASAIGDWRAVQKIAQYPTDVHSVGYTKEDRAAYLALASLLRGEPPANRQPYFVDIERRKKQKPKLLAEVIRSLQAKDGAKFRRALGNYLHYYRRSEFTRMALSKLLCLDGTTLLNIGSRNHLEFNIPAEAADHIICLR